MNSRPSKPPAYISDVQSSFIRLVSIDSAAREAITNAGLRIRRRCLFDVGIYFDDAFSDRLANDSLVDAFSRLNLAGIAFADSSSGWPPAAIMRELQARGRIKAQFTTIVWRGPDDWHTSTEGGG